MHLHTHPAPWTSCSGSLRLLSCGHPLSQECLLPDPTSQDLFPILVVFPEKQWTLSYCTKASISPRVAGSLWYPRRHPWSEEEHFLLGWWLTFLCIAVLYEDSIIVPCTKKKWGSWRPGAHISIDCHRLLETAMNYEMYLSTAELDIKANRCMEDMPCWKLGN